MAKNGICHVEFESTNLARTQAFLEEMFGWTFRSFGETMVVFGLGDTHVGGLQKVDAVTTGSSPSIWIEVDDLDAYLSRAERMGGGIKSARSPVPGVGFSGQISDPDGNTLGLVEFEK